MEKIILISARDYLAITQWDDDGGSSIEMVYDVQGELSPSSGPCTSPGRTRAGEAIEGRDINRKPKIAA